MPSEVRLQFTETTGWSLCRGEAQGCLQCAQFSIMKMSMFHCSWFASAIVACQRLPYAAASAIVLPSEWLAGSTCAMAGAPLRASASEADHPSCNQLTRCPWVVLASAYASRWHGVSCMSRCSMWKCRRAARHIKVGRRVQWDALLGPCTWAGLTGVHRWHANIRG
jgi:hypothetical protein